MNALLEWQQNIRKTVQLIEFFIPKYDPAYGFELCREKGREEEERGREG
jgi:hypothetical protein